MVVFLAIILGLVGAVVCGAAFFFASMLLMAWFGVSDFEGARSMGAAATFLPLGGLLGLVGGIGLAVWITRAGRRAPPRA